MHFDEGLGQWQAKAGSVVFLVVWAVDLTELGQCQRNIFRRHADSRIDNLEHITAFCSTPHSDRNLAALLREFDGVHHQVDQDLLDLALIGDAVIMASDCRCTGRPEFKGISLTLTAADEAEADRLFGALADGGQVQMPLGPTFFSPSFGVIADRFGVSWMIIVEPA